MAAEIAEDRNFRRLTLVLMALATVALELALAEPDRPQPLCVLTALGLLVAPPGVLAWLLARRRIVGHRALGPLSVVALLGLFALPFAIEIGRLVLMGRLLMLEVILLKAIRNLGLGLATLAYRPVCARLSAIVSLFLLLTASPLAEGRLILAVIGLYAVAGTLWLLLAYWKRIAACPTATGDRRLPVTAFACVAGMVVALAAALVVGPTRTSVVLMGLMPTSGGTLQSDPDARSGVNDGDNEVSASKDPQSVGFTQSEIYLDSDRPTLYDAFNEMYGEPYKPKEMDRMIALGARDVREQQERPSENLKAGREFALVRRKPDRSSRRPGDRAADAMVYIKGPTPLHLPLSAYDCFDGRTWLEEPHSQVVCPLELESGGVWIFLDQPKRPIFSGTIAHQIKIGTLSSSPLPFPPHVERFRVGSVNRTDFFGWAQEGILRMVGRTVPAGTVLETEARTVDLRRLALVRHQSEFVPGRYSTYDRGYSVDPRVAALARGWVAGVPEGWGQVEAIVAALRQHCTHARDNTAPADCTDIVAHFLFDSRRGPDYLFATAAVVLLRSQGYPARVVSGLYAAPERYDVRTRQTPVTREDVHFWAEVVSPGRTLVAIEPTPGYRLSGPSKPWSERLAGALRAAREWGKTHAVTLVLAVSGMAAGYRFRGEARDALATSCWWITSGRAGRGCVLMTLRLVERRSGWAGYPRPPGRTLARWYGPIMMAADESRGDLGRLVRVADRLLYSAEGNEALLPWDERDIRILCRRVVRAWTLGRFRAVVRSQTRRGTAPCSLS